MSVLVNKELLKEAQQHLEDYVRSVLEGEPITRTYKYKIGDKELEITFSEVTSDIGRKISRGFDKYDARMLKMYASLRKFGDYTFPPPETDEDVKDLEDYILSYIQTESAMRVLVSAYLRFLDDLNKAQLNLRDPNFF